MKGSETTRLKHEDIIHLRKLRNMMWILNFFCIEQAQLQIAAQRMISRNWILPVKCSVKSRGKHFKKLTITVTLFQQSTSYCWSSTISLGLADSAMFLAKQMVSEATNAFHHVRWTWRLPLSQINNILVIAFCLFFSFSLSSAIPCALTWKWMP